VQYRGRGHTLRDQLLGQFDQERHQKDEREDEESDGEWRQHAADHVAVNQSQHRVL
jgi:hypothetical protein